MKKIVRLTESDLVKIVKRVMNEQHNTLPKTIEGSINRTGNHPGYATVNIKSKSLDGKGFEGILTEWDFGAGWGVKVGDKVMVTITDQRNQQDIRCTLYSFDTKHEFELQSCKINF